jgi:hypothetical protein
MLLGSEGVHIRIDPASINIELELFSFMPEILKACSFYNVMLPSEKKSSNTAVAV